MANKPVDDLALQRLYGAIMSIPQPSPTQREAVERQARRAANLREIQTVVEGEKIVRLAKAVGLPIPGKQVGDDQLLRLFNAVR